MSIIFVLVVILLILMIAIGGERGAKAFFTLCINFITLFVMIGLMAFRLDPIKVTVYGSIVISSVTLFYINGFNKKTIASLIAVTIVVLLTLILTYKMGVNAKIQGFGEEQADSILILSLYVHVDFAKLVICVILLGLLGAIIDVSISISSSMNEIFINNSFISKKSLLKSGINIGKDILGTMTNTLLFVYIGGFMTLTIWFSSLQYSISQTINAKVFCSAVFPILCSGIGIILIIPTTAIIMSMVLFFKIPEKFYFMSK